MALHIAVKGGGRDRRFRWGHSSNSANEYKSNSGIALCGASLESNEMSASLKDGVFAANQIAKFRDPDTLPEVWKQFCVLCINKINKEGV